MLRYLISNMANLVMHRVSISSPDIKLVAFALVHHPKVGMRVWRGVVVAMLATLTMGVGLGIQAKT